jgi:hypothetical protein
MDSKTLICPTDGLFSGTGNGTPVGRKVARWCARLFVERTSNFSSVPLKRSEVSY